MVEFGINLDGCGLDYDLVVGGMWLNGIRFDFVCMWCILLELFLMEIFLFDDYVFFSLLLWYNCLYRYSSLFLYFVRFLFIEIFLVWMLFWNNLELCKMWNLVLIELSFVIIWWGLVFCFFGCLMWCEFIILLGESLIFVLEVVLSILVLVFFELDLGMLDNFMSGCWLYCLSLFRFLCRFMLFFWSCLILFCNGLVFFLIMLEILLWREFLMVFLIVFVIFFMLFVEMVIYCGWEDWLWVFGFNWMFGLVGVDMLMGVGGDGWLVGVVFRLFLWREFFFDFLGDWLILIKDLERFCSVFFCDLDIWSELLDE